MFLDIYQTTKKLFLLVTFEEESWQMVRQLEWFHKDYCLKRPCKI